MYQIYAIFFKLYHRRENIKHAQLYSNVSQHMKINTPIKTNLKKKDKPVWLSFLCHTDGFHLPLQGRNGSVSVIYSGNKVNGVVSLWYNSKILIKHKSESTVLSGNSLPLFHPVAFCTTRTTWPEFLIQELEDAAQINGIMLPSQVSHYKSWIYFPLLIRHSLST